MEKYSLPKCFNETQSIRQVRNYRPVCVPLELLVRLKLVRHSGSDWPGRLRWKRQMGFFFFFYFFLLFFLSIICQDSLTNNTKTVDQEKISTPQSSSVNSYQSQTLHIVPRAVSVQASPNPQVEPRFILLRIVFGLLASLSTTPSSSKEKEIQGYFLSPLPHNLFFFTIILGQFLSGGWQYWASWVLWDLHRDRYDSHFSNVQPQATPAPAGCNGKPVFCPQTDPCAPEREWVPHATLQHEAIRGRMWRPRGDVLPDS